ncbi:MAG: hypothetical protein KJO40_05025 [Deltaproteobacteria bacterium]|nr:hypothetical protein [Deltaproteobacteria bacterium]
MRRVPIAIIEPGAYNWLVLRLYFLSALVAGVWVAGCSSPTCLPGLIELGGRCLTAEEAAKACQPACNPVAHEVCAVGFESPECVCAPGYEGTPCTWSGVLESPGFDSEGAWTASRGATVLPSEEGPIDDGIGVLAPSVGCGAGALSQRVDMPDYEAAEPLVVEVTYRTLGTFGASVGFNRAWTFLESVERNAWATLRTCLGEAAYGGAAVVQFSAPERHPSCDDEPEVRIEVDRMAVVPAEPDECPAPGAVLNPDAEPDEGGWRFVTSDTAQAGFAEGVGSENSSGVRLARASDGRAAAWTRVSVPSSESLPSPALRFWWRGTRDRPYTVRLGRFDEGDTLTTAFQLDDLYGNSSGENYVYCLPPWTHGNVLDLIFRMNEDNSGEPSELVVDDVEIVSDPRCGTATDLLDPGFDAGPTRYLGVTQRTPFQATTLRSEPALSRTGDGGVLELSYWNEEAVMRVDTWVFVPEPSGNDGPALAFWANVPLGTAKVFRTVVGRAAVNPQVINPAGGWFREEVCLPPEWFGRWYRVQWRLGESPPMGTTSIEPPIRIYIDDLELTTSSACPAD